MGKTVGSALDRDSEPRILKIRGCKQLAYRLNLDKHNLGSPHRVFSFRKFPTETQISSLKNMFMLG